MSRSNYHEQYRYDPVGNITEMLHSAAGDGSWRRRYEYGEINFNNRLSKTSIGQTVDLYSYDLHGNMTSMQHLPSMTWNFKDHLASTQTQIVKNGGHAGTTYYIYDSGGQRARKVDESGKRRADRVYLGGFEIYREYASDGSSVTLERTTLHVMDDKHRVALVESRNKETTIRYQFDNHLGSSCLELDDAGSVITYEEYYPFGSTSYQAGRSVAEVSLKRYRFTGRERDEETGFSYHKARYYAPWLARWISCDPIGIDDSTNVYQYVKGDPVIWVDDTGTQRNQLWLAEQKNFEITPVATRTGRGITPRQQAARRGIDDAFGPGNGMDWGHPANQTHGTTRAGQSPPLRPQPSSENRASYQDKLAKQAARERGEFVRDAKGVDTTVKAGTKFEQPPPRPFEDPMSKYADTIEQRVSPTTTPRAEPSARPIGEANPNQLEFRFDQPQPASPSPSKGATGSRSPLGSVLQIAGIAAIVGQVFKDLHEGDTGAAVDDLAIGGTVSYALAKIPALVPLAIMVSTISAYDDEVQEHANSVGQWVENKVGSRYVGAFAASLAATGESLFQGTFGAVGRSIGEGAAAAYLEVSTRLTSDEYTFVPWKSQLWADIFD